MTLSTEILNSTSPLSLAIIEDARDWLSECDWQDMEADDFLSISPQTVLRAVERHYSGGLKQFLTDGLIKVVTPAEKAVIDSPHIPGGCNCLHCKIADGRRSNSWRLFVTE